MNCVYTFQLLIARIFIPATATGQLNRHTECGLWLISTWSILVKHFQIHARIPGCSIDHSTKYSKLNTSYHHFVSYLVACSLRYEQQNTVINFN